MATIIKRIAKSAKQHNCFSCGKVIPKGSPYYLEKDVDFFEGEVYAERYRICPKCNFTSKRSAERFQRFKPECHHPIVDTVYRYIPGESVKEPDYDRCLICGKVGV